MQNHKKDVRFSCPLDCFDACGLVATVVDNHVRRIRGDRDHPLTRGVCCIKGIKLLERLNHPQRLTSPLRRSGRKWVPVTWPEALDDIADRLTRTIGQFGSAAILNYAGSGHGGLTKKVDDIFFNYLGGDFKKSQARARNRRTFSIARLAEYLETEDKPPIRSIFVSKANPLVQGPDINRTAAAFAAIDFKVVIDLFITDTARHADLVLPCTSVLEEEDIVHSSMFSPYVNYSGRAVLPPEGVMGEYEIFRARADGCSPVATYIEAATGNPEYPLRLITPHRRESMHSQHFAFIDDIPEAVVSPETLQALRLTDGERARVSSDRGTLLVKIRGDSGAAADAVTIEQGWWHKSGSVNVLTSDRISEMGEQAAYYDCFVHVAPATEDQK